MAQREPTAMTTAIQLANDNAVAAVTGNVLQPGRGITDIPIKTELMAEGQLTKQAFIEARTAGVIVRSAGLYDGANAEVVQSMSYANHLRRGFGDGTTELQEAIFTELDRTLGHGVTTSLRTGIELLAEQAANDELPSTEVSNWAVARRWVKNNLT